MAQQALVRLGDTAQGTCLAHSSPRPWTGVFTTATGGFFVEGVPAVAVGDSGVTDCGHTFILTTSSSILRGAEGRQIGRVGDAVTLPSGGDGVIITGANNAFSE